jgi:membrane carboxypeptidase/penicillin-binding protein
MQCAAEKAIESRIAQIAKGRKAARDLEGSLVALEPSSGEVRALVGGRDFGATSFIRATQARRQPGSAFKPIIYAAALERGMAPASVLHHLDEPIMTDSGPWLPGGEHEETEYTLRTALKILEQPRGGAAAAAGRLQPGDLLRAAARHRVAAAGRRLARARHRRRHAARADVRVRRVRQPGIPRRPAPGRRASKTRRPRDLGGRAVEHQAVTPATAYLMTSMLADVVNSGTATAARAAGSSCRRAGRPAPPTTTPTRGSSATRRTSSPASGSGWIARADHEPRVCRRRSAVPAWADFMKQATAGDKADWFTPPADVQKVTVCRLTGQLATDACRHGWTGPDYVQTGLTEIPGEAVGTSGRRPAPTSKSMVYDDYFPIGSAPTEPCAMHGAGIAGIVGDRGR